MKQLMKQLNTLSGLAMLLLLFAGTTTAQELDTIVPHKEFPDEYIQVTHDRAHSFVKEMELNNAEIERVTEIVARQYRDLSAIQDTRDARIERIENEFEDQDTIKQASREVRIKADMREDALHRQFIAKLTAEITPEQVNQVKDGMTYNVVPITYNRYTELLPELTDQQKVQIKSWLLEAREYAMDAGSSDQKHHIFNDYKGKINNYVSSQGYNLAEAEEKLENKNMGTR